MLFTSDFCEYKEVKGTPTPRLFHFIVAVKMAAYPPSVVESLSRSTKVCRSRTKS